MILFFYNLALLAALVVGAPWWLWKMATTHKYREGCWSVWAGSAGLDSGGVARGGRWTASGVAPCCLCGRGVGGEPAGGRAGPRVSGHRLVVSTTTRTGQELARQRFGRERVSIARWIAVAVRLISTACSPGC